MIFHGGYFTRQLAHSDWEGFTLYDLVYPCFLFVSGFSLNSIASGGGPTGIASIRKILSRSGRLFLIGICLSSISSARFAVNLGTLQCIAISFAIAGSVYILGGTRLALVSSGVIYIGYYLLSVFARAPGIPWDARWVETSAFTSYLDTVVLGKPRSEEGLLPTLCASTFVLAGAVTSTKILQGETNKLLIGIGILAALGMFFALLPESEALFIPILSRGFSPTYCLTAITILSAFYLSLIALLDSRPPQLWTAPFRILGANALFAYCFHRLLHKAVFERIHVDRNGSSVTIREFVFDLAESQLGVDTGDVVYTGLQLFFTWLCCAWLWKKQRIIKV